MRRLHLSRNGEGATVQVMTLQQDTLCREERAASFHSAYMLLEAMLCEAFVDRPVEYRQRFRCGASNNKVVTTEVPVWRRSG